MKKILYMIGLIAPGLAVKAIAQEIPPRFDRPLRAEDVLRKLSVREQIMLKKYDESSQSERAVFLYKAIAADERQPRSNLNQIIIQSKVEDLIRLPEHEQREALIQMILNGGIKWGSVGDPTDRTR